MPKLETKTRVLLLQHPRERDMPIGTARMAHLCLSNSELHVGVDWQNSTALRSAIADPARRAMLLYPSDGAADVASKVPSTPVTLIVVDGTWSLTRKMVRQNPILAGLPRLSFQPSAPSNYRIRREPKPNFLSTIEALATVLGVLEGDPENCQRLLEPFRRMVDRQIELRELNRTLPCRHAIKQQRIPNIPPALRERKDDIVCVVGEANAWPYRSLETRDAYPDELVHWVAWRIATHEAFEFIARPRYPLAPNTTQHIALGPERLERGGSFDELRSNWRSFVRDTDILCSWGCYATGLLAADGGYLPQLRFDLRALSKDLLKRKLGTMDRFLGGTDEGSSLASGRAGVRLRQLVQIAQCFSEGSLQAYFMSHQPGGASLPNE